MFAFFVRIRKVLVRLLETAVTVITGILVLDVVWQVFTRFVLRRPSTWTEELATMLLIWVALLGAGVAFARGGHLGVDYFVGKLPTTKRRLVELLAYLVTALFSLVMIYGGWRIVSFTLMTNQLSAALKMKMGYVYLALPISGFFILILSLEMIAEKTRSLTRGTPIEEAN